jgi:DNA-binding MurR/RpiR family transcriptional regulator
MGFRAAMGRSSDLLTKADRQIGHAILLAGADGPWLTAHEIGVRTGVHESSVVRFAQKLGYSGYSELREDLKADLASATDAGSDANGKPLKNSLAADVRDQIAALQELPTYLSQEAIVDAAAALATARRIFINGQSFLRPLVDFMARKLRLMGFEVVVIGFSGPDLHEDLASYTSADALLTFAFSEEYSSVSGDLHQLTGGDPRSILVTDHPSHMLSGRANHVLSVARHEGHRDIMVVLLVLSYSLLHTVHDLAPHHVNSAAPRGIDELDRNGGARYGSPPDITRYDA